MDFIKYRRKNYLYSNKSYFDIRTNESLSYEDGYKRYVNEHKVDLNTLKKYMRVVLKQEGVTLINSINKGSSNVKFTNKEIELLNKISNEL